jgi:hypothetical protein
MTSESGDHGNNEYNYIGIDLSDSLDGIKMNTITFLNWSVCTNPGRWAVMYICMLCVSILTFYECSFRFYNCHDSVVFVVCFFHLIIHEYITIKSNTLIKEHFDLMTKLKQQKNPNK